MKDRIDKRSVMLAYAQGLAEMSVPLSACAVDEYDAATVISIFEQPRQERLKFCEQAAKILYELGSKGKLDSDAGIDVNVASPGGVMLQKRKRLYWRICSFLVFSLKCDDQEAINRFCTKLRNFIGGEDSTMLTFYGTKGREKPTQGIKL